MPHSWLLVPGRQVFPSQHPLGQLAGVQTQVPFWHSVPAGQAMQIAPAVPQSWFVFPGRQVVEGLAGSALASQQPEQLAVVHTQIPFWQSRSEGQDTQVTPPVPQNSSVSPVLQVLPSQQPFGQLAGVQTQLQDPALGPLQISS